MTLYDTLGVPKDASAEEIKSAFRRNASTHHPDREGGDAEKMAKVNRAYEVLSNPDKREHYDKHGDVPLEGAFGAHAGVDDIPQRRQHQVL